MADKKIKSDLVVEDEKEIASVAPLSRNDMAKPAPKKKYYERADWKGVKEVFRCETCGTCRDDEDSMIEHVLIHIPVSEQERVFDQLIKEKK